MDALLSGIQRQFHLNTELYPDSSAYNIPSLIRIEGFLDRDRLMNAWRRVFMCAYILRSRIESDSGMQMAIDPECELPWSLTNCCEEEVHILSYTDIHTPFRLSCAPFVRVRLFNINENLNYLLIVQHHIVTDLYSKELLFRLISLCYADPEFFPSIVPYNSFIEAEAAFLDSNSGKKSISFWKERMSENPPPLHIPSSNLQPLSFSGSGKQIAWQLPPGLDGSLINLRETGRPLFLWLLTAYVCTLSRLSGQREFLVGVPFTNRLLISNLQVLGPCVNILPVKVSINNEDDFSTLFDRLRAEMLLCHRNQAVPFLEIARFYGGEHDPLRPRLLQAGFTSESSVGLSLPGLQCMPVPLERNGAQMDVYFSWWESGKRVLGTWEYNESSFGPEEVALWVRTFNRILEAAFLNPDIAVTALPLLEPRDISRLAEGPQSGNAPLGESVASILRESYAEHTSREALIFKGQTIQYSEFADKIRKIALCTRNACGTGGRVVVCCERSAELVIALHGIIHSGNAYVPIGVDWPSDRVSDILEDINPSLILTQTRFADRFSRAPCPVVFVGDLLLDDSGPENGEWPSLEAVPDSTFYILYTSGTTGKPKGVDVPHQGIANHLRWIQDRYRMSPEDRCLLKTTYTFDVSVWELYWPFVSGACLVIAEEQQPKDPREILGLCREWNVTRINFVPSLLELFLDQDGLDSLSNIRHINCIGEALPLGLSGRCLEKFPTAQLHNLYGPTEASVSVSFWDCSPADSVRGTVPIGYPMENVQLYVVDDNGQPCPPLVKGELLIGGICLAHGYWNRPELTAEKFIPNPFGPGKLYRTGDWCRYGLDGAIEYLERKDTQTKFRGIRLELGEIEAYLQRVPGIAQAVVIKGRDSTEQECLIAYCKPEGTKPLSIESIRDTLRERLPDALIPAYYRPVDTFPMNDSGKVNRKGLPDFIAFEASPVTAAVNTDFEARIAGLWHEVIGTAPTDFGINFFDMGGNSMSLLVLRGLLEREFEVSLKVHDLFSAPTVKGMARIVDTQENTANQEKSDARTEKDDRVSRQRNAMGAMARRTRVIR